VTGASLHRSLPRPLAVSSYGRRATRKLSRRIPGRAGIRRGDQLERLGARWDHVPGAGASKMVYSSDGRSRVQAGHREDRRRYNLRSGNRTGGIRPGRDVYECLRRPTSKLSRALRNSGASGEGL